METGVFPVIVPYGFGVYSINGLRKCVFNILYATCKTYRLNFIEWRARARVLVYIRAILQTEFMFDRKREHTRCWHSVTSQARRWLKWKKRRISDIFSVAFRISYRRFLPVWLPRSLALRAKTCPKSLAYWRRRVLVGIKINYNFRTPSAIGIQMSVFDCATVGEKIVPMPR